MTAPVSLGFLTPAPDRVTLMTWSAWTSAVDECELPERIPDWDYFTALGIECEIDVDLPGVLADCGLDATAEVAALLTWHSSWTRGRGCSGPVPVTTGANVLRLELPGEELGGRLSLELRLVLARAGDAAHALAPKRLGSTLCTLTFGVTLEGAGRRFPVVALDFTATSIAGGRRAALWALQVTNRDVQASGTGSVLILLNTAHPAVSELVEKPATRAAEHLAEFLRYDLQRQLVTFALQHEELTDRAEYEEGTLGHLLISLVRRLFPDRDLEGLRGDWHFAAGELEAEIQAQVQLMGAG